MFSQRSNVEMEEKWPDLHLLTGIKLQFSNTLQRPQAVPLAAAYLSVNTNAQDLMRRGRSGTRQAALRH